MSAFSVTLSLRACSPSSDAFHVEKSFLMHPVKLSILRFLSRFSFLLLFTKICDGTFHVI